PNHQLSNPAPRIGFPSFELTSRQCAQISVLPVRVEPLPKLSDKRAEIPTASSAAVKRTSPANMHVPMNFFIKRILTNTTISIPTNRHMVDVALCACLKSHKIPINNQAINQSSFRL